jgi:hypothetical protein
VSIVLKYRVTLSQFYLFGHVALSEDCITLSVEGAKHSGMDPLINDSIREWYRGRLLVREGLPLERDQSL